MSVDEEQLQIRVAWLYFMEGVTQGDIAERLGMTRLRVNRILSEARASGLVGITLNSRLAECVELEQELAERFALQAAAIIPTPVNHDQIPVQLGRAAGDFITRYLEEHRIKGFGVGWGATLRETLRHVRTMRRPELCVNSMMGGLTHGLEINTFEIASELARRLSAECEYFAAPIYAGSPESRDTILAQDVFRGSLQRIAANELALLSIGDLSRRSLLVGYGLPQDVDIEDLRACGAVGDVLGQFFDRNGQLIDHPLNRRAIALPLYDLRHIRTVILAAGGHNKSAAIAGALRAGIASVLVCDVETARAAMKLAEQQDQTRERQSSNS
ncbi:MAG: sugar-binding transcriptional regulator [Alphaproteobacteria bacterium]